MLNRPAEQCHPAARIYKRLLDPAPFARAATIVGYRRYIADRGNRKAGGLQRAQRRFTARTGALDLNFQGLHAMFHRLFAGIFGGDLGGIGG